MTAYYRIEIYFSFNNFPWHMYLKPDSLTEYNHWELNLIIATVNPHMLIKKNPSVTYLIA